MVWCATKRSLSLYVMWAGQLILQIWGACVSVVYTITVSKSTGEHAGLSVGQFILWCDVSQWKEDEEHCHKCQFNSPQGWNFTCMVIHLFSMWSGVSGWRLRGVDLRGTPLSSPTLHLPILWHFLHSSSSNYM